jgi:hypothetical protein
VQVETVFLPWVFDKVIANVGQATLVSDMADQLLTAALDNTRKLQAQAKAERAALVEKRRLEAVAMAQEEELVRAIRQKEKEAAAAAGDAPPADADA